MMLAYQPIRSLATINMAAYQGGTAFKRVSSVFDKKIDIVNNDQNPNLKIINSEILFTNVSFKYDQTKRAIKNINLNIKGSTLTAFVGHSGAGKSTIINSLPRFYDPQDGSIQIGGQDIRSVSLKSLRKNLSLVSQDVILFDDTIKKNIAC